jgi:hypothetical protein
LLDFDFLDLANNTVNEFGLHLILIGCIVGFIPPCIRTLNAWHVVTRTKNVTTRESKCIEAIFMTRRRTARPARSSSESQLRTGPRAAASRNLTLSRKGGFWPLALIRGRCQSRCSARNREVQVQRARAAGHGDRRDRDSLAAGLAQP